MKKILISVLIVLFLILCFVAIFGGIEIGGFKVLSISSIKEANDTLDDRIKFATVLASTEYPNALSSIETDLKKLDEEKKNYESMVTVSNGEEVQTVNQYQKYEIEYLWTTIGNHATSEGVVIKIDIVAASGENKYNLNFTVNGSYIGITDFISDIENDSALGFKIENFSMKPGGSTQNLEATFTCKDITIKDISKSIISSNDNQTNENTQENNELNTESTDNNNTNTTNTNSTTNNTTANTVDINSANTTNTSNTSR